MKRFSIVPFRIERNKGGTYAVIENPDSKVYGIASWAGEKVVRSPFNTPEEARQRVIEISDYYKYTSVEVEPITIREEK